MVEVTYEHQGAGSLQNGKKFVPQVQFNTRVTRGTEEQYAKLAAVVKVRGTALVSAVPLGSTKASLGSSASWCWLSSHAQL